MVELTHAGIKSVFAPPLVPVERPIDAEHLSRMTLGDRTLEREVLGLFVRQIEVLRPRIGAAEPDIAGASAHTLKGSATGIGAWAVARAAAEVEACAKSRDPGLAAAVENLDLALSLATAEISDSLHTLAN